jgi:hypothetical protein
MYTLHYYSTAQESCCMDLNKQLDYGAPKPGESTADFRDRLAQRQAEAIELRRRELAEQISDANTPAARIKIWERLHQITLPRNPDHRLLSVISVNTGLTLDEVLAEQRQRTMPTP